jgi:hypothetical protein
LTQVDFDPMASRNVMVAGMLKNLSKTLVADCERLAAMPGLDRVRAAGKCSGIACRRFGCGADDSQRSGRGQDFKIVVVNLVFDPGFAKLVQALKAVKILSISDDALILDVRTGSTD